MIWDVGEFSDYAQWQRAAVHACHGFVPIVSIECLHSMCGVSLSHYCGDLYGRNDRLSVTVWG